MSGSPIMRPRRSFMAALSAIVAAPAAVAVPALAAKVEITESPEFLALAEEAGSLIAQYREATARLGAEVERYERNKPALPDELIEPERTGLPINEVSAVHVGLQGNAVQPYRRIYNYKRLMIYIIGQDVPSTTRRGRHLRRLARPAKRYEAAEQAARTPYYEAWSAALDAGEQLGELVARLLKAAPATMAGAKVFAEIVVAIHDARQLITVDAEQAAALGAHLAQALIRLQGDAA